MSDMERWHQSASDYGWKMPSAPWWKRLPVIRHIRAKWTQIQVERWYAYGPGSIGIRSGYDSWVIYGIWHGKENAA